jgi:glycosyltransferase involved in cell wall biosynthesis
MTGRQRSTHAGSSTRGRPVRVLAVTAFRPAEVVNSLAEMDAETELVEIDGDRGRIQRGVETVRKTRRAIRTLDPDVILLDTYEIVGFLVAALALYYRVPLVTRVVGDSWRLYREEAVEKAKATGDYPRLLRAHLSGLLNWVVFTRSVGFVVVSNALRDVVHQRTGCPRERIGVVPVPVTKDTWQTGSAADARAAFGVDEDRVVLTVTNLRFRAKFEGVTTIVEELSTVLSEQPDVAYVVAGGGSHYDEFVTYLDETVDDPTVRRRIYALGHVEQVADLYALADVFVYVSHLDGYPNVVLEAQTAGLPVVANPAFGMREQIPDDDTGRLIDPERPGAIREAVSFLLANPEERGRIGTRARERVREENTTGAVGEQLDAFLTRLVADLEQ